VPSQSETDAIRALLRQLSGETVQNAAQTHNVAAQSDDGGEMAWESTRGDEVAMGAGRTVTDVTQYMVDYLHERPLMYSDMMAQLILRQFGESFVTRTDRGTLELSPDVLRAFKLRTKDEVIWAKNSRFWRQRLPSDGPSRQVPE
jgi:hypothetical protein